jgi:hypothetical protein
MVRLVLHWEAIYGHAADVSAGIEAFNEVCRERGWVEYSVWASFYGKGNEFVLTADYPDISAYVAERDAALTDADFMKPWRQVAQHLVQGSMTTELLEPVPELP